MDERKGFLDSINESVTKATSTVKGKVDIYLAEKALERQFKSYLTKLKVVSTDSVLIALTNHTYAEIYANYTMFVTDRVCINDILIDEKNKVTYSIIEVSDQKTPKTYIINNQYYTHNGYYVRFKIYQ